MDERRLKVGELARRTGVSVRALHHYHDIGLLEPERRTTSGHRLYDVRDVARLQQIQSLRTLGFGLQEIRTCLDEPGFSLRDVVTRHLEALEAHIDRQQHVRKRLIQLRDHLDHKGPIPLEELLETVEATTMMEKHYTREQLERLAARRDAVGAERIREVEDQWTSLIPRVQGAMDRGARPVDADVKALAEEWRSLTRDTMAGFTGGDPDLEASLHSMWQNEPGAWNRFGMSPELVAFIGEAVASLDD